MESSAQEQRERQAVLDASSAAMKASAEAMSRQYPIIACGSPHWTPDSQIFTPLGGGNGYVGAGRDGRPVQSPDCSSAARDSYNEQCGIIVDPS
jgi:hypothetical protein